MASHRTTTPRSTVAVDRRGLDRNVPRSLQGAVERRLRALEADEAAFDRAALAHRARLKRLYAVLHVAPSSRAQASLFERRPPAGSPLEAVRRLAALARSHTPAAEREAAALVRQHALPYLVIESALGTMREPVAVAFVEAAPLDELLARLALLARRELLRGPVQQALIARLQAARADDGLTYAKVESVIRRAELDAELSARLLALLPVDDVAPIRGTTALLVDVSASVERGELGLAERIGALVDAMLVPDAELRLVAYGLEARRLPLVRASADAWRALLAHGPTDLGVGTSVGAAVRAAGDDVERFVIVTDGTESRPPRLASVLLDRRTRVGRDPEITLVQWPDASRQLAVDLKMAQVPCEVFPLDRHGLGVRALARVLSERGTLDRVEAIRAHPIA